ncbi:MAE_28990/MAE_18760 family HEPN-like nuclease [Psychrobacter sp. HY3-MNA-CIBAN-0198]|uniref:MAE_28990/MAE_18760 family HEPN-like nuclease n=1 Tax=Psychrobacter sp. HY3-MNA-CIBAN-0198 TaxID=3140441 RepID=UPI00332F3BE7
MSLNISNIYLKAAYDIYLERLDEVKEYIEFINVLHNNLDDNEIEYINRDSQVSTSYRLSSTLEYTIYSSTYLMIYNLIESSANSIIYSIHENIDANGVKPHDLNSKLYRNFLRNFKNFLNEENILKLERNRSTSEEEMLLKLLSESYTKEGFFNGNIDFRVLKKTAKDYGFLIKPILGREFSAEDLLVVKSRRNKLAHGAYSFSECGKSVTFQEGQTTFEVFSINGEENSIEINTMNHIFQSVENVLDCMFLCLNDYLKDRKYLAES